LNFNADQFNIQIRAREYYGFFALSLISVGVLFQIPVGVLAVTRMGIITPEQLSENRRYAVLVIAILAMLLPGTDPVTMLIAMIPLLLLFEFSILLARAFGRARDPAPPDLATGER
jgi:sec-independent protein translocase protein TatC